MFTPDYSIKPYSTHADRQEAIMAQIANHTAELSELRRIADAAVKHANIAEAQAKEAKRTSKRANVISIVSLAISAIAVMVQFLVKFIG